MAMIQRGRSFPLGATVYPGGVNFCLFSKHAERVELLLFDQADDPHPAQVFSLTAPFHRTANYWHIFVPGLGHGQVYAYRVYGPFAPERGHRFDGSKVLLDPYARLVVGWERYDREAARRPGDNCAVALRGVVVDPERYDWEGDVPLEIPYARTIIYEMHVKGFTAHANSGVSPAKRGTYAGVIEKIPYLQSLGVTAVELMPIHEFDEQDARPGLANYWGYSTLAFFAPHRAYSADQSLFGPVNEFRDMVKALHRAGIEVILDVVFNHTAEGNHEGPTLSFRGIENQAYYILETLNPAFYANYSGCGNTVKANHEIVGRLILDSLRYWVDVMHVDGFRFDLASILSRSKTGSPLADPPLPWLIESDPVLAGTKIIAEAWDAAGLYQVGSFIGERFAEWNGPFRDDVRRFVKGDRGMLGWLAARLLGSPDLYRDPHRIPNRTINFVTCHDGFTLYDLVSYNHKHNEANGEQNRDGSNDNYSWNCGWEGPTDDPEISALRVKQMKNFLVILALAQGTPMILMGDEVCRTQRGNNNAYCQDNEISWFDWDGVTRHREMLTFWQKLLHWMQSLRLFEQETRFKVESYPVHRHVQHPYVVWHGTELGKQGWHEDGHALALEMVYPSAGEHLYIILNSYWESLPFTLPPYHWQRLLDTHLPEPITPTGPQITTPQYQANPRSSVILRRFAPSDATAD